MKVRDFQSNEEVAALVAAFEAGAIGPTEFTHTAHIAVGLAYLDASPLSEAADRMRRSLCQFLERHELSAYHETLTVFWMRLLDHLARTRYAKLPLWERINRTIASHGSRRPVDAHYSSKVIASAAARASWIEPDLLPLVF